MTRATAYQKRHAKARQRRRRAAQERLARDRRQAQHAAEALQQALDDLGPPEDLVIEIEGRLRRQQKLRLNLMWADLGERGVRYVIYSFRKGGSMSTKELIQAELDTLSDADLDALYALIKQFIQSKRPAKPRSLMATLRGIHIDAPPDFAANLDLYVSGEKRAEPDLH
jgi:hypothetical protein